MWEEISPYVSQVLVALIQLMVVVILAGIGTLRKRIKDYIDTNQNKMQREIFHKIANEAFAYAETVFSSETSRNKLNQAFMYASSKLGDLGINLSKEEVMAAIERACLEHNANKVKILKEEAS